MSPESEGMTKLVLLAFMVLIGGLIMWRLSGHFAKKKRKPKGSNYFKTDMKDKWERR